MRNRIIAFVSAFIISINCINSMSLTVFADGGGSRTDLETWNDWSFAEKADFYGTHMSNVFFSVVGVVLGDLSSFKSAWMEYLYDREVVVDGVIGYEEWLASHLGIDENNNLVVDDELADHMYQATNIYIEEYCGWYECETMDYRSYLASEFNTQGHYNAFISYCTQNIKGTDKTVFIAGNWVKTVLGEDGETYSVSYKRMSEPLEVEYYVWNTAGFENDSLKLAYITQNWQTYAPVYYQVTENGNEGEDLTFTGVTTVSFVYPNTPVPLTDGSRTVRVYKTLEDLKQYSVGQLPYYYTSKFQDYDINGDNSCIISESELNGSSIYGDVTNIVINYPDADGLTEDELRRILDEYFDNLDDDDSGNGSGSGSGSGLGDLLDGIGSVGNAIMSILGKLLEYIGKALDLISGTVTKVIDIIPKNITNLLGAIFPFFPQEWLTAIELALVLAVIVGIVGLFKK